MILAIVRHHVRDYAAWRKVYDGVASLQQAGGVIDKSVYQDPGDPNDVLVLHSFADLAAANAFFRNPDLRAAMQQGGVEGPPRIEIFQSAD